VGATGGSAAGGQRLFGHVGDQDNGTAQHEPTLLDQCAPVRARALDSFADIDTFYDIDSFEDVDSNHPGACAQPRSASPGRDEPG
jgi:hypothetical protein